MTERFEVREVRYFRLPFIPLVFRIFPSISSAAWKLDRWILRHCPAAERYATIVTMKLRK